MRESIKKSRYRNGNDCPNQGVTPLYATGCVERTKSLDTSIVHRVFGRLHVSRKVRHREGTLTQRFVLSCDSGYAHCRYRYCSNLFFVVLAFVIHIFTYK